MLVNDERRMDMALDLILIDLHSSTGLIFGISSVSELKYCIHACREGSTLFLTWTGYVQLGIGSIQMPSALIL